VVSEIASSVPANSWRMASRQEMYSAAEVPGFIVEVWNRLMMSFRPNFREAESYLWRSNSQTRARSSILFSGETADDGSDGRFD